MWHLIFGGREHLCLGRINFNWARLHLGLFLVKKCWASIFANLMNNSELCTSGAEYWMVILWKEEGAERHCLRLFQKQDDIFLWSFIFVILNKIWNAAVIERGSKAFLSLPMYPFWALGPCCDFLYCQRPTEYKHFLLTLVNSSIR